MFGFFQIIFTFLFYNSLFFGFFLLLILLVQYRLKKLSQKKYGQDRIITFLHPNCNDCGGGEKVLWTMLKSIINETYSNGIKINIVAGHDVPSGEIMSKVKQRFNIDFNNSYIKIEFIRLKSAFLLKSFPNFTMIIQIIGQIIFAFELLLTVYSHMVIDSTGLPFMLPVTTVFGRSYSIAYVHYPLISYDMIGQISRGESGVHSRGLFSKLKPLRYLKIVYYYVIYLTYKAVGYFVHYAFTNSSWTDNHIKQIWTNLKTDILYPPCSTKLYFTSKKSSERKNQIISFAQFRPEKNHRMQVEIFSMVKDRIGSTDLTFYILGSIRGKDDQEIFDDVYKLIVEKNLKDQVFLIENPPFDEVKRLMESSKIGIHTMRDEHFGISIVEMMSAGLLTIAHKSGGPLNDIIGQAHTQVGLLANSK